MSLGLILVLLLSANIFWWKKFIRSAMVCGSLSLLLIFSIGYGLIPDLMLNHLQEHPPAESTGWNENNVIVILGAGTLKWSGKEHWSTQLYGTSRVMRGARLYQACRKSTHACKVLVAGGVTTSPPLTEAGVMRQELLELGIPAADILSEEESRNTFHNAKLCSQIIETSKFDKIYIVTSGFHLKRSLLYFSHFNIKGEGVPADQLRTLSSLLPASYNFTLTDLALHEFIGIARFHYYNFMGLN